MAIWSSEIKELEKLYESFKGQFPEIEKELLHLIKTEDENVIMLYSRRCLEIIITDLCECELKRPRQTEPLKGVIDKLHKEGKVPPNIISSMHGLNELSTYGTHPKDFDPEQVKPVLINLDIILKWYLKYKETVTDFSAKPKEESNREIERNRIEIIGKPIPRKRFAGILSGLIAIIVTVFAVLYFSNIIGGSKQTKELEKSIAVLPFINDSPNDSTTYFLNGVMEEILNNLQKIKDFSRVLSRTSVEQFRGEAKTSIPEIAQKLGVNFIVEGSGQKYGNKFVLRVQLIAGRKERHLWGESYEREIRETSDIVNLQSQIAQAIAAELKAIITPEEKQRIEKIPTANLVAHEFYLKGKEEQLKFSSNMPSTRVSLELAKELFKKASEIDPMYAQAYVGMAQVYWSEHYWENYLSKNFLDSVLIFLNKALSIDDQLAEAYDVRGSYYQQKGLTQLAVEDFDKALKYNPNDFNAYHLKGLAFFVLEDYVKCLDNLHKAVLRNRGADLPGYLEDLAYYYVDAGFPDKAKYYYNEACMLDRDSAEYFGALCWIEFNLENFEEALKLCKKEQAIDSTTRISFELYYFLPPDYYKEAYLNAKKRIEDFKKADALPLDYFYRIGIAFWRVGKKKEAEFYFNQQISYDEETIKLGRWRAESGGTFYDLAATYAFLGEKAKAYKYLDEFNKRKVYPMWWPMFMRHEPFFDSIRGEERFQKILRNIESKYLTEHERVRKWLEEQGML